jgi:hypothetical protein
LRGYLKTLQDALNQLIEIPSSHQILTPALRFLVGQKEGASFRLKSSRSLTAGYRQAGDGMDKRE